MEISQAEFAKRAGVSRQAVNDQIKRGHIVRGESGGIDPDHPVNAGYLARALHGVTKSGPKPREGTRKRTAAAGEQPGSGGKRGGGKSGDGSAGKSRKDEEKERLLRAAFEASGINALGVDTDEMLQVVMQKGYWDTLKVKEDVLKRQIDREREVGSVIDQRILESLASALGQAIVANFVDSPQKQAIQICQMLGAEGKEKQVTEFLEKDNERRLEEAERAVRKIADQMKRGVKLAGEAA